MSKRNLKSTLLISAFASLAAVSTHGAFAANGEALMSGDVQTMNQWYGRAGGLAGSDRIAALKSGNQSVAITFDTVVAERTNMGRTQASTQGVTVVFDEVVAERTNMSRATGNTKPYQAAGLLAPKAQ